MTVYVAYMRGAPQRMRVFGSRKLAARFVAARTWPPNYVIRSRTVLTGSLRKRT